MELSSARKERIEKILRARYGIETDDNEITRVDRGLRDLYSTTHDQRVVTEIVTRNISEILLKHRTKENVLQLERLFMQKLIFRYLMYASMCYRCGVPAATIVLCRTAIEAGLRERIAERRAEDADDSGG